MTLVRRRVTVAQQCFLSERRASPVSLCGRVCMVLGLWERVEGEAGRRIVGRVALRHSLALGVGKSLIWV